MSDNQNGDPLWAELARLEGIAPSQVDQHASSQVQVSDNVSASVTRHGRKLAQTVDLIARRDTTHAAELLAWRLSQTAEPRTVTFDVPAHLVLSVGLAHGQMVTATHRQGATANGWIEKELYVRGGSLDQQNMVLSLICDDLEAGSP